MRIMRIMRIMRNARKRKRTRTSDCRGRRSQSSKISSSIAYLLLLDDCCTKTLCTQGTIFKPLKGEAGCQRGRLKDKNQEREGDTRSFLRLPFFLWPLLYHLPVPCFVPIPSPRLLACGTKHTPRLLPLDESRRPEPPRGSLARFPASPRRPFRHRCRARPRR